MKKIIFLFILTSTLSCKKEWFDYTNKYTGNFKFTVDRLFFDIAAGVSSRTTYEYNGTIKRIRRGELKIKYGPKKEEFLEVEVDKDGKFSNGSFSGRDYMEIYYQTGGNGGGTRNSIEGIRN